MNITMLRYCAAVAALAWITCGCAHSHDNGHGAEMAISPQAPPFLNGPMAVLLTNAGGFSAHVSLQNHYGTANAQEAFSGQLLGRGGQLLFLPVYPNKWERMLRVAGLSFLWDVADGRGYVLSEALQAYAPYSGYRATNVLFTAGNQAPEKIEGLRCVPKEATVVSSEGAVAVFEILQAPEAKELPLRIAAPAGSAPLVLSLSNLRLAAPAADIFQVPASFTRYESAEGMMSELAVRQANLKRKEPAAPTDDSETPGGIPGRRQSGQ
jgi:hypothetical protein